MHSQLFDEIASALREMGYPALSSQLAEGNDVYQLTVSLPQAPPLQIVGFFLSDLLRLGAGGDDNLEEDEGEGEGNIDFLQLFIRFPFEFADAAAPELARLMMMINWTTPVGTFGINEPQKIIYYRQVLQWQEGVTDPQLVLSTISGMEYYAAYRYKRIQAFASGEMNMVDFMQDLEATNTLNEEFPGYDLRN
ncbi:MAG: hypothetical protein AAGU05_05180 [Anaerolineaceae bacterium]